MSLNMLHSIAFAKWLLNRNIESSPLEVLTLLEDTPAVWDLFIQSEDFLSLSRTSVDILIPQLVEKVPVNKRPTKKNVKPKPVTVPVFKTDAQTSTDDSTPPEELITQSQAPLEEDVPVPLKKETKKRAPKKSKVAEEEPAANIVGAIPPRSMSVGHNEVKRFSGETKYEFRTENAETDAPVTEEGGGEVVPPVPLKKEPKKRAPKKSKVAEEEPAANIIAETDAPVTEEGGEVVPTVPLKKETKKRAPKKSKVAEEEPAANIIADAPVTEEGEVVTQEDEVPLKKETKKRAPKKSKVAEEEPAANIIANTEGEVVPPVPLKKEPKKRAPKKSKTGAIPERRMSVGIGRFSGETKYEFRTENEKAEEPIIANTEGEDVPVVVPLKKETKKRAPKKSKPEEGGQPAANIIADTDHDTDTDTELTEVVLPLLEQLHLGNSLSAANANDESRNFMILQEERSRIQPPHNNDHNHDHELSHESYNHDNHDTELTEVFVNDVLFYTNHDQSLWFDSSLSPTNNPI